MQKFDKRKIKKVKDLLYNSYVHDAKLEKVEHKYGEDTIDIEVFNPIFNVKIHFVFYNIGIVLAIPGKTQYGSRETIISLTVEEDFSYLQSYLPNYSAGVADSLYLLFQMFSGDELHIVSKEVSIEIVK